jgi:hypothetical protein
MGTRARNVVGKSETHLADLNSNIPLWLMVWNDQWLLEHFGQLFSGSDQRRLDIGELCRKPTRLETSQVNSAKVCYTDHQLPHGK